jgi:ribosomal-protein-alanine N-acetyltransferase
MELEDVSQVLEVDRESYTLPWPASAYRREILHNRNARYLVLRRIREATEEQAESDAPEQRPRLPIPFFRWTGKPAESKPGRPGEIIGYAGMWIMLDEAHITTIALRSAWRGRGLGELLLASLIELATGIGSQRITLEVRVSNDTAQNLYRKYGFHHEGTRPRYYSDNNEDAHIMSTGNIQDTAFRRRIDALVDKLRERLLADSETSIEAPAFPVADAGALREAE